MVSIIGVAVATILVIYLVMKGAPILFAAIVCSAIVALTGGLNLYDGMMNVYMGGFVGYFKNYFFMFLVGSLFGKVMEESRAADAIAFLIIDKLGSSRAVLAVVLACGAMCYGGISLFVVVFTIYPIAVSLYKKANFPRRFIPGAIAFGSVTFSMTAPGAPQIHNIVPANILGTTPMAGAVVGIIASLFLLTFGMTWYTKILNKAIAMGEKFEDYESDNFNVEREGAPNGYVSFVPMIVVILLLNAANFKIEIAVGLGIIIGIILFWKNLKGKSFTQIFVEGSEGAINSILNSTAMVGFGVVVAAVPAFNMILDAIMKIPGPPLIGVAVVTTLISGISGSGSSAVGIVTPILGPEYLAMGVPAAAIHRIIAISSGGMDTMPHAGYVCTTLKVCGNTTHKQGYGMIMRMTVITPLLACALAIVLFTLFPNWP